MARSIHILVATILLVVLSPVAGGPITSAATYGLCVTTCGLMGVFSFGPAVVATGGAAAAPLVLAGPGVFVSCASMCTQMIGLALAIPTP